MKKDDQIFALARHRGPTPTLNREVGGRAMKKAEMLSGARCGLLKCRLKLEGQVDGN